MSNVAADPAWAEDAVGRRSHGRAIAAVVAAATVAMALTLTRLTSGSGSHQVAKKNATTTATVQRTNLAQTTPLNGTIGFASAITGGPSPVSIVQPGGSPPSALNQAQQSVTAAEQTLAADQRAAGDANAVDAQSVAQAQQSLSTAQAALSADTTALHNDEAILAADQRKEASDCQASGSPESAGSGSTGGPSGSSGSSGPSGSSSGCSADSAQVASDQKTVPADRQKVASDRAAVSSAKGQLTIAEQKAAQSSDENEAKVAADQLNLSKARSAAADAQRSETAYDQSSKYTALPVAGQIIQPGTAVWSVDGRPVVLLPATLSPWRAFTPAMTPGPDVTGLNRALVDLGDGAGLTVSDTFSDATAAAIDRLQGAVGLPQTGILPLGSVIFAPGALRVTTVHPPVGGPVAAGAPVLDVTSTTPVVNVALPVGEGYLVKVGDPVSVKMADGTTTDGAITAVGTVATTTTPTSGPSSGSPASSPAATINVTVTTPHATGAGLLDQAPVTVNITNGTATDVLAVPTTALLPIGGGGYAVEVVAVDGTHHLVAVTTGIFDDQAGLVQVSGAGLAAGQRIVAAA